MLTLLCSLSGLGFTTIMCVHAQPCKHTRSHTSQVAVLTLLYSLAGLGIAIVNDFKSIEGDRALGLMSLPVQFGIDTVRIQALV